MKHKRLALALAVLMACSFIITAFYCLLQPPSDVVSEKKEPADWFAEPFSTVEPLSDSSVYGYTPTQIKAAYNLPTSGGNGVTIAIIVAYDTPAIQTNLATFSSEFGLPTPDSNNFEVHKMSDSMGTDVAWTKEASLNVEWAHAIAPEAKILLVEAVNNGGGELFAAIDYATSRPDVDVVSISWGIEEVAEITDWDSQFNVSGKVFFASAGNTLGKVFWPACSPYVISVGGTTLTLNPDNSVASEVGWYKGGGGVSIYEIMPQYQIDYGLSGTMRCVPDVSYNADSATGYPIYYNSTWSGTGGTSAGAPQWAAIYALDLSASQENIYRSAKTVDPPPFRDIVGTGATLGYDYVTGLGSPTTANYDLQLRAVPTQGPPSGAVQLNGEGFIGGSTVDIEYLNPITSIWTPLISDLANPTGSFNYGTNAFDVKQNNLAGDYPAQHDNIAYRAVDTSNGYTVNTSSPYMEWRRGLTQINSLVASGVFGEGTDLSSKVIVGNTQLVTVVGKWFSPGTANLMWDGTEDLGEAPIDSTGSFSATFNVPTYAVDGKHTVTINDGSYNFSFELTSQEDYIPFLNPVPEGSQMAIFAVTLAGMALVMWIKRK